MTSFNSDFYRDKNDDGSFTQQRRQRLRRKGWSEEEINQTEEVSILHTRIDRENALARKRHDEYCEEHNRRVAAELEAKRGMATIREFYSHIPFKPFV